ncbi:MAG: cytochrome C [Anaerolineae bacterium]|nr:cytochrome C [Anaerolineae bacterium]
MNPLASDLKVMLPDGTSRPLLTYLMPSAVLMLAAFLLMLSMFLPYWSMTMFAPQYPKGLKVEVFVNRLVGDVQEIDALNHYLGMPPLDEGGKLERQISMAGIIVLGLLLMAAVFVHNKWAAALALPALTFPFIFLADLYWILYTYGHSIDPTSALGGAIAPFTPPLVGEGVIAQFRTIARLEIGFWMAIVALLVLLAGLWLHRAAYKPVVEARQKNN